MIGTNEIDCFFGLASAFDKKKARVVQVHSIAMAIEYLNEQRFDAILINLEPNGQGGIGGIEILSEVIQHQNNQDAVCFSVSAVSASLLLTANTNMLNTLSIIVGWLTVPIKHQKAVDLILDIVNTSKGLSVKYRLPQ